MLPVFERPSLLLPAVVRSGQVLLIKWLSPTHCTLLSFYLLLLMLQSPSCPTTYACELNGAMALHGIADCFTSSHVCACHEIFPFWSSLQPTFVDSA